MGCSNLLSGLTIPSRESWFLGCDNKPISDSLLRFWMEKAAEEENYKWAAECMGEIYRRSHELIQ